MTKDFNIICAVALNGVIGDSVTNSIPWHLPSDLQRFKQLTDGNTIVMGTKTFNSLGRLLPNRKHVVITRGGTKVSVLPHVFQTSFARAMHYEDAGFFVIGGEHIFGEALRYLPLNLYITIVDGDVEGDVRFPIEGRRFLNDHVVIDSTIYDEVSRGPWVAENGFKYQFTTFRRRA